MVVEADILIRTYIGYQTESRSFRDYLLLRFATSFGGS